jgi:hypothetical protein
MVRPKDDFYPNFQITGISREDADRIVAAVRDDDQLWNALIEMQKMPDADDEGVWFGL